jgi:hypothetical protein
MYFCTSTWKVYRSGSGIRKEELFLEWGAEGREGEHGSMYQAGIGEVGGMSPRELKNKWGFIYRPFRHPCWRDPCPWSMATVLFSFFLVGNSIALGRGRSSSSFILAFVFRVFGRQCGLFSSGINHIVIMVVHLKKVVVEMSVSMGTSEVLWYCARYGSMYHPQARNRKAKVALTETSTVCTQQMRT